MKENEFREKLIKILEEISVKLDRLKSELVDAGGSSKHEPVSKTPLDVDALLSLPDHLRQTAMVVSSKGSVAAEEVAEETRRTRAAESDYLNQLVKMNYISKRRKGRIVYFYV